MAKQKQEKGRYILNSVKFYEKKEIFSTGVRELCRGRTAFAYANIAGENGIVEGTASFYYTPLGMLVYVCMCGLDEADGGVYSLEIRTKCGGCVTLPPLYCKNGNAWSAALTGKIATCDILGGRVIVGDSIAEGGIRPPILRELTIKEAE